jgi:hypothetical protein
MNTDTDTESTSALSRRGGPRPGAGRPRVEPAEPEPTPLPARIPKAGDRVAVVGQNAEGRPLIRPATVARVHAPSDPESKLDLNVAIPEPEDRPYGTKPKTPPPTMLWVNVGHDEDQGLSTWHWPADEPARPAEATAVEPTKPAGKRTIEQIRAELGITPP